MQNSKSAKQQARQGDVFFEAVDASKVPAKAQRLGDPILAHGEVTGHCHRIVSPALSEMDSAVDESGDIFVRSHKEPIQVTHDEHGTVTLPAGEWWVVTRQREYDPLEAERERRVQD